MSSNKEYYAINFVYLSEDYYLIWYSSDDIDGFLVDDCNVCVFRDLESLYKYAENKKHNIELLLEIGKTDIDIAIKWINGEKENVGTFFMLGFWNTISDIAYSLDIDFLGDDDSVTKIYNKLTVNEDALIETDEWGTHFPKWNNEEMRCLDKVIEDGINIVCKALKT